MRSLRCASGSIRGPSFTPLPMPRRSRRSITSSVTSRASSRSITNSRPPRAAPPSSTASRTIHRSSTAKCASSRTTARSTASRCGADPPARPSAVAVDEPHAKLDQRGTRRAPRVRMREGIEVLVDGNTASLVDLSTVGAQVVCTSVLKPNQRVRVTLYRCEGRHSLQRRRSPGRRSKCRRACRPATAPASISPASDPEALGGFADRNKKD